MERAHRVLSPTAILGYGFPTDSFYRGLERAPHVIGVDAGSTDPGPYYLGAGESFTSRASVKRDLDLILPAAVELGIPLIIGSAGGAGAREHVDWTIHIIEEIAGARNLSFRLGIIYSDIPPAFVLQQLEDRHIHPLRSVPALRREDIEQSVRIVAQIGAEPVEKALQDGCQVVVCGRCYDPIPFIAPALLEGYPAGLAYHMGKILECGAIAATPGSGRDCILGTISDDGFVLEALNPSRRFTCSSAAAHTLYEKGDPCHLPGPGGAVDLRQVRFQEVGCGRVKVTGSQFIPSRPYTVKLEGVKKVGYRTICLAGIRDPVLIDQLDGVLARVRGEIEETCGGENRTRLLFRAYGRDGVMGDLEPNRAEASHELGLVIEALGTTQEDADGCCALARSTLLHLSYPGRVSTAGNLAFPYSPSDIRCGPVYGFSIYHLLDLEDPARLFPFTMREVPG